MFAVLNGIGLLIQDAAVAFNYYLLRLGHDKLAGFIALNAGIVLATLFRFWSYRRFVWVAPPAGQAGDAEGRPRPADRPPQTSPTPDREGTLWTMGAGLRADVPSGHKAPRRHGDGSTSTPSPPSPDLTEARMDPAVPRADGP